MAQQIWEIIVLGLSIILTVLSIVYGRVKGSSSKFLTNCISLLTEISSSMEFAEKMMTLNGEEKKTFASKYIKLYCENKGFKITDEQLSSAIETLISLTNKVNAKERTRSVNDLIIENNNELVADNTINNQQL